NEAGCEPEDGHRGGQCAAVPDAHAVCRPTRGRGCDVAADDRRCGRGCENTVANDDGGGGVHVADRVPECLESSCCAWCGEAEGDGDSRRTWCRPFCSAEGTDDGDSDLMHVRRSHRTAAGAGGNRMAEAALARPASCHIYPRRRNDRAVYV